MKHPTLGHPLSRVGKALPCRLLVYSWVRIPHNFLFQRRAIPILGPSFFYKRSPIILESIKNVIDIISIINTAWFILKNLKGIIVSHVKELKWLKGYLQVNEGNGNIEIVIENMGYGVEQGFNFIITDKGRPLWGGMKTLTSRGVEVIKVDIHVFKAFKEAKEIHFTTGMRDERKKKNKNKYLQYYSVKIIKEDEIKEAVMEYYKWEKNNNKKVYYD